MAISDVSGRGRGAASNWSSGPDARLVMEITRTTTLAALAAIAGCSGVGSQLSPMGEDLGKQAAAIVVGESDRESVRALLGAPWLTSDYWHFDLFRSTDRDSAVFYLAFVPVARASQDVRGLMLVTYATDGAVTAFDSGLARGGNILGPASRQTATLRASGVAYWESEDGESFYLAVDSTLANAQLEHFDGDERCRMLVATVGDYCSLRVAVDDQHPMVLPPHSDRFPPSLLPVELKPGLHTLRFTSGRWACSFETGKQISCAPGKSSCVNVALTMGPRATGWQFKQAYSADLTVSDQPLDPDCDYGLIIYANGRWLVPQEPGH